MKVNSKVILENLNYQNVVENCEMNIQGVSILSDINRNTIVFVNKYKEELVDIINQIEDCFILLKKEYDGKVRTVNNIYVFVDNPRYEYAKLMNYIIKIQPKGNDSIELIEGSYISSNSSIDESVTIEPGCYIGRNVKIAKDTVIMSGARIKDNVTIGKECIIRENSIIGGFGFGFDKDPEGKNFRIPHIGGVVIGDNVEIGAATTVCAGTIKPTLIENFAKIDDHVHIAHNCVIGENCTITACAEISGSCKIGKNTWLAPNTSVINGITIGEDTTIGMGAVIIKSVEAGAVMVGSPADTLERSKKFKSFKNKIVSEEI